MTLAQTVLFIQTKNPRKFCRGSSRLLLMNNSNSTEPVASSPSAEQLPAKSNKQLTAADVDLFADTAIEQLDYDPRFKAYLCRIGYKLNCPYDLLREAVSKGREPAKYFNYLAKQQMDAVKGYWDYKTQEYVVTDI